jgi:hypothetical protein
MTDFNRIPIHQVRSSFMIVMVIVKASKASDAGEMPSTEMFSAMEKFSEELINAGIMVVGAGLTPSSRGARVRFSGSNRTVTDGPFAETTELIAGFSIWKVSSLQEAIDWVKKSPNGMFDDSDIEIRPLNYLGDFVGTFTPEVQEEVDRLMAARIEELTG